MNPAFALHRLGENRHRAGNFDRSLQRRDVIERHVPESLDHRLESLLHLLLPRRRNAAKRAPVKTSEHRHDADPRRRRIWRNTLVAEFPRELVQRLIRLRAGVAKEHLAARIHETHEPRGEFPLRARVVKIRHMHERRRLLLQHAHHPGMRVADARHRDACAEIQIALPILVPHFAAASAREPQIKATIGRNHVPVVKFACGDVAVLHFQRAANIAPPRCISSENARAPGIRTRTIR